jgi:hypothetical protein
MQNKKNRDEGDTCSRHDKKRKKERKDSPCTT